MANAATPSSEVRRLFVGGISQATDEETLKAHFSNFGQVTDCQVLRGRLSGYGRGFGFINFADQSVAERVLEEDHYILGTKVQVSVAKPKEEYSYSKQLQRKQRSNDVFNGYNRKKIFLGGLHELTKEELINYFESFGKTVDAVVMRDKKSNKPRGFGFVTFELEEAVDRVLERSFHEVNNKRIEVKRAVPKDKIANCKTSPLNRFGEPNYFYSGWGLYPTVDNFYGGPFCYQYYPISSFYDGASTSSNGWITTGSPAFNVSSSCMSRPHHALMVESNGAGGSNQEAGGVNHKERNTTKFRNGREVVLGSHKGKEVANSQEEVPIISHSSEASSSQSKDIENENAKTQEEVRIYRNKISSTSCGNVANEVVKVIFSPPIEASSLCSKDLVNVNADEM